LWVSVLVVNIFSTKCGLAMLTSHHTAGCVPLGPVPLLIRLAVVLAVLRCVIAFPEWHGIICLNQFFPNYLELLNPSLGLFGRIRPFYVFSPSPYVFELKLVFWLPILLQLLES
jgi:hypothetical protein